MLLFRQKGAEHQKMRTKTRLQNAESDTGSILRSFPPNEHRPRINNELEAVNWLHRYHSLNEHLWRKTV
jgi:hypothetical protein